MKNLISISGNSTNSGKDLVGNIIQYLIFQQHFDSSERFRQESHISYEGCGWQIKKFATKTTEAYKVITGVDFHKLNRDEKELERPRYRDFANKNKEVFGEDVWSNALFADYKAQPNKAVAAFLAAEGLSPSMNSGKMEYPKWIITDTRYPCELEAVKERGGLTIRVTRPRKREVFLMNANTVIDTRSIEHPSETALNSASFDEEILNDGSIEDLIEKVRQILIKHEIL